MDSFLGLNLGSLFAGMIVWIWTESTLSATVKQEQTVLCSVPTCRGRSHEERAFFRRSLGYLYAKG